MLRLSKKADYALIAMKHLAHKDAGAASTSAREIAEQYDIPMSRRSVSISVADVIEAIDGPFTVTACSSDKHDCEQYGKCSVRGPLWQIRERIVQTLGMVTLADMASDQEPTFAAPVAVVRRGA